MGSGHATIYRKTIHNFFTIVAGVGVGREQAADFSGLPEDNYAATMLQLQRQQLPPAMRAICMRNENLVSCKHFMTLRLA